MAIAIGCRPVLVSGEETATWQKFYSSDAMVPSDYLPVTRLSLVMVSCIMGGTPNRKLSLLTYHFATDN